MSQFINPYTFVGLPTKVERCTPPGHAPSRDVAEQRYTGTLRVAWTIKTPIAAPTEGSPWGQPGGPIRIPGASAKGAIRSVHETLFAGCLRVVDTDFTPVYRGQATPEVLQGWRLAIVVSPPGESLRVVLCDPRTSWVEASALLRYYRTQAPLGLPRTGDFITPGPVIASDKRTSLKRGATAALRPDRASSSAWLASFRSALNSGMSVLLVTDTAARDAKYPFYWAAAKLGKEALPVTQAALGAFYRLLAGARDRQPGAEHRNHDFVTVEDAGGSALAERRRADGQFQLGDVIWVKHNELEVTQIKLSAIWRVNDPTETLGGRIRDDVKPCPQGDGEEHDHLCLSCSVFGSADEDSGQGQGRQASYAGHVRFGDITAPSSQGDVDVVLAPLSSPSPGSGMYYLEQVAKQGLAAPSFENRRSLPSQWSITSGLDKPEKRKLRGRKFYWHGDPDAQAALWRQETHQPGLLPRYRAKEHHDPSVCSTAHLVRAADLEQTITFDGLDATALMSLLASIEPHRVLGGQRTDYATHLGRGKPLGLGTVQAEIRELIMTTTADRYAPEPRTMRLGDETHLVADFVGRCGDLADVHRQAKAVFGLTTLGDNARYLTYPTMEPWRNWGTKEFDQSFRFFAEHTGEVTRVEQSKPAAYERKKSWRPLPLAHQAKQIQEG